MYTQLTVEKVVRSEQNRIDLTILGPSVLGKFRRILGSGQNQFERKSTEKFTLRTLLLFEDIRIRTRTIRIREEGKGRRRTRRGEKDRKRERTNISTNNISQYS